MAVIFCRSCGLDRKDPVLVDLDQRTGVCLHCAGVIHRWNFTLLRYVGTETQEGHQIAEMFKRGLRPVVAKDGN